MLATLHRFGDALRRGGLAISSFEIATAGRAMAAIDLSDRRAVRAALATTLVKRREHKALFDELFEQTFALSRDRASELEDEFEMLIGEEGAAAFLAKALDLDPIAKALVGLSPGDPNTLADAAGVSLDVGGGHSSVLAAPVIAYRFASAIGLDAARERVLELLSRELPEELREAAAEIVSRRESEIRGSLRRHAAAKLTLATPNFRRQLSREALATRPFAGLNQRELAELRVEVDRMARALISQTQRRRSNPRRGRLNVAATMRRSISTGGVPFQPVFRLRQKRRPHIVLLCDISDSVRNASRFMLQLAYTVARLTEGVRAFAFVAELGELTGLFRGHSIETALSQVANGAVVNVLSNSNYGTALTMFAREHLGTVRSHSTVLVIGDGRSNYHDPGLEALAAIRQAAGQLLWINPESSALWGFGDSAMNEYRELCDRVFVAGNLLSFQNVMDQLFGDTR